MSGLVELLHGHFRLDFWAAVGFCGQLLFTARFLVQWLASERRGESIMPVSFWYFSIGGGLILLVYAIAIGSLPFILGQAAGLLVYSRNLRLIRNKTLGAPAD